MITVSEQLMQLMRHQLLLTIIVLKYAEFQIRKCLLIQNERHAQCTQYTFHVVH